MTRFVMVWGTSSGAGKSWLATALSVGRPTCCQLEGRSISHSVVWRVVKAEEGATTGGDENG